MGETSPSLDKFRRAMATPELPATYADAIHEKGAPLVNWFGFIDGTVRSICRPTWHQKICYNGHKRIHAIKFQSMVIPNGLVANLYGSMEGRRHDCALLRSSGLMDEFAARQLRDRQGLPFALYGALPTLCGNTCYALSEAHTSPPKSKDVKCSWMRWVGVWQDLAELCIPRLPGEPESGALTRGQVLPRRSASHQLSHMSVWEPDKQVLQAGPSTIGRVPLLNVYQRTVKQHLVKLIHDVWPTMYPNADVSMVINIVLSQCCTVYILITIWTVY